MRAKSLPGGLDRMNCRRWGGVLTVELLLAVPILLVLLGAMVEFSMLLVTRQQLLAASREGARAAALGGDQAEIEAAVQRSLGAGRLQAARVQTRVQSAVNGQSISSQALGAGDLVEVSVRMRASQAAPHVLGFIGFSAGNGEIVARTAMRKE